MLPSTPAVQACKEQCLSDWHWDPTLHFHVLFPWLAWPDCYWQRIWVTECSLLHWLIDVSENRVWLTDTELPTRHSQLLYTITSTELNLHFYWLAFEGVVDAESPWSPMATVLFTFFNRGLTQPHSSLMHTRREKHCQASVTSSASLIHPFLIHTHTLTHTRLSQ